VEVEVEVGGTGVGVRVEVAVGGIGVFVRVEVLVGGTGVLVRVDVKVGGTGVLVRVGVLVKVGVLPPPPQTKFSAGFKIWSLTQVPEVESREVFQGPFGQVPFSQAAVLSDLSA